MAGRSNVLLRVIKGFTLLSAQGGSLYALLIIPLLLFPLNLRASSYEGLGPLNLSPVGLSDVFRSIPSFVAPNDHPEGKLQITFTTRMINIWAYHLVPDVSLPVIDQYPPYPFLYGSFLLDMEIYHMCMRASFMSSPNTRLELIVPVEYQGGGITDRPIEGFHRLFNLTQHRRDQWPRSRCYFMFVTPYGQRVTYGSGDIGGFYIGNIGLGGSWKIRASSPALSLRLLVNLPTTNEPYPFDEGLSVTAQASLSWRHGNLFFYHGLGYTWYESDKRYIDVKTGRFSFMTAIEYAMTRNFSIVLNSIAASPTADYPELEDYIVEVSVGLKKRLKTSTVEFDLIENLLYYDNSPDFGLQLSIKTPVNW